MFYQILEENVSKKKEYEGGRVDAEALVGIFSREEMDTMCTRFSLQKELFEEAFQSRIAKFENFEDFDFVCLNVIDFNKLQNGQRRVMIYMEKNLMLFVCDDQNRTEKIIGECIEMAGQRISASKLLHDFFCRMTNGDRELFDDMEKEILGLEKALITSKKQNCVKEIISLRKRLMVLKRYYEQFSDLLDGMIENENKILEPKTLKYYKLLEKRMNRMYENVLNLQDYVTQVRESYQAEVDISLNMTMKIFTVITTIFLPLTLIAGWYGMNLNMPEYQWEHGYLFVCCLSVVVVVAVIFYFRKKNWF